MRLLRLAQFRLPSNSYRIIAIKIPACAYCVDTSFAISSALAVIASLTGNLNATRKVNEQYLKL